MKLNKYIALLIIVALFALVLSCESMGGIMQIAAPIAQVAGVPGANLIAAYAKAFEEITPEQEYYIGRAVGANVLGTYKLQTNKPATTAYVNRIANALIINSPRPEIFVGYHVGILDSDEINAFATPGGHIFITRGLISCATTEDTLASVIAHEIAHIQLQHGLQAIKSGRRAEAFASTLSFAAEIKAGDSRFPELVRSFSDGVGEVVTTMMTKGYSRTQEYEADAEAMRLLSLAGYKPSSLLDMLRALERTQSSRPGGFNNTHPTPAQRIENAQKEATRYNIPDTSAFRTARFRTAVL